MNLALIGNCQIQSIKHALGLYCADLSCDMLGVHLIPQASIEKAISSVSQSAHKYDAVVSMPLSDTWGSISSTRIRETFAGTPVVLIPNIYFSGLHPDLTYIGSVGERVQGLMGDYHSKIALLGYLRGLSVSETQKLYCHDTYYSAGYYQSYDASLRELTLRERDLDIKFTHELSKLLRTKKCFLSMNHPTTDVFASFSRVLGDHLSNIGACTKSGIEVEADLLTNFLAKSAIYPVFPEIVEHHSLPYHGSYTFKSASEGDAIARLFDLNIFVEDEYRAFGRVDQARLSASRAASEVLAWEC